MRRRETGNRVALRERLDHPHALSAIEGVEAIRIPGVVPEIHGPAIDVHDRRRRSHKSRCAIVVEKVRPGDQLDEPPDDGIRRHGPLRVAEHEAVHVHALALPHALVGGEKEAAPAGDRSAQRSTELVPLEAVRLR